MVSQRTLAASAAALALAFNPTANACTPTVNLKAGTVYGHHCPNSNVQLYQGIPYAKPPVNELRFMPPEPLEGRYPGGFLNATKAPSSCVQFGGPPPGAPFSEDCLYVDVYVPEKPRRYNKLYPVKVYSYGGTDQYGDISYPLYNGCNLATDAIVVTLNYRLGPLGFMGLTDAGIKGNMAIKDNVAALRWVHDNIAAFGGNKEQVVYFGESAGADNGFVITALPEVQPLLKGAVLQSGGGQEMTPLETANKAARSFAGALGCNSTDLHCLQSKSAEDIILAYHKTPIFKENSPLETVFHITTPTTIGIRSAILDGEYVKEEPLKTGPVVPLIAGTNENESSFFIGPVFLAYGMDRVTEQNYTNFLNLWGPYADAIRERYPLSAYNTTGHTGEAVVNVISHIATLLAFGCQNQKILEAARNNNMPAYGYKFGVTSTCPWEMQKGMPVPSAHSRKTWGATHTSDVPFVFASMDNAPFGKGNCTYSENEKNISKMMVSAWTAMAVKGNPSTCSQKWPVYDVCERKGPHMMNGTPIETIDYTECDFWNEIWTKIGGFPMPPKKC